MRPLSGRHAVGGFKITTLGRGGLRPGCYAFAMSAGRNSRRASVAGMLSAVLCGGYTVASAGEVCRAVWMMPTSSSRVGPGAKGGRHPVE
jgi:hypothetical protein